MEALWEAAWSCSCRKCCQGKASDQSKAFIDLHPRNSPANQPHTGTSFCKCTHQLRQTQRSSWPEAGRGDNPVDHREYSQAPVSTSICSSQTSTSEGGREGRSALGTRQCSEPPKIQPRSTSRDTASCALLKQGPAPATTASLFNS